MLTAAVSLVLVVTLTTPVTGFLTSGVSVIRDSYPTSERGVEFGTGYSTITLSRTFSSAVRFPRLKNNLKKRNVTSRTSRNLRDRNGDIRFTFKMQLIKTLDEFHSAFEGSISASANYMGVEGSSAVHFLTETYITSLDSVLVATVDSITDTKTATNARFKDKALELLEGRNFKEFVETYGTHYLRHYSKGGKLVLVMKFSSSSQQEKMAMDIALAINAGTFRTEAEFSSEIDKWKSYQNLGVDIFATGGTPLPDRPEDVVDCIRYAIGYSALIRKHPTVREVEYVGLWTIPGDHARKFKDYLFPLQTKIDTIMGISADLLSVDNDAVSILALEESGLASFNSSALDTIDRIQNRVATKRNKLKTEYKKISTNPTQRKFDELINKFSEPPKRLATALKKITEDALDIHDGKVTLKHRTGLYISTAVSNSFTPEFRVPRLDRVGPVTLQLANVNGAQHITIRGEIPYVLIKSVDGQDVLCMIPNKTPSYKTRYEPYHKYENYKKSEQYKSDVGMCEWRIVRTSVRRSQVLEYGDSIILYNRRWSDHVMGVSSDGRFLNPEPYYSSEGHHEWLVGRPE